MGGSDGLDAEEIFSITLAALMLVALVAWPVLPGLKRLGSFKAFPPFRDWAARPHPDAAVGVQAGRRLHMGPRDDTDAANATVVVRTAYGRYPSRQWSPDFRVARPLVPVVSVDGMPASWGWGTTKLTLPPGRHLIAVTSSHTRSYEVVDLARGERRDLDYCSVIGAQAHRYHQADNELWEGVSFGGHRSGLGRANWYVILVFGIFALAALLTILATTTDALDSEALGSALAFGAMGVGVAVGLGVIGVSLVKQFRRKPTTVAHAPAHGSDNEVRILDDDEPERLAPAPGWAALSLHLRYMLEEHDQATLAALAGGRKPSLLQRWRAVRIGEPEAPACRPWVPAPEVSVDGRPIKASWTRMWLQLPPGPHDLTVSIPAPRTQLGPSTRLDLTQAEWRRSMTLPPGETTEMTLTAEVKAVPDREGPHLSEFRARLR
ncbi:hypothetical protein [Glycomyces tarimensis]